VSRTRAAKRRRAGRKRKMGERVNGKLKQAPERGWANMNVVLVARCARRGLRPTDDNLRKMRDQREGSVLGRLLNDNSITEAQHDAGYKYETLYRAWARTAGMGPMTPPAGSYGLTIAGRDAVANGTAEAAQTAYFNAADVLDHASTFAVWEVKRVCLEDQEPKMMDRLGDGLDLLVAYFG